jgi:DNA-binding FadR family transcriptional regulator
MSVSSEVFETSDVVRLLDELIGSSQLRPGDRLPSIRELADRFGVKAGLVRDGLLTAQARGMVRILPRVGAIVESTEEAESQGRRPAAADLGEAFSDLVGQSDRNLFHILETREALELSMTAKATQRRELSELYRLREILAAMVQLPPEGCCERYAELDVEFHLEIGRLSGNSVMQTLLRSLLVDVRPHLDRIQWSDDRRVRANESHARIYSALAAGDADAAESEMRLHIREAYDSLLDQMRIPPQPTADSRGSAGE